MTKQRKNIKKDLLLVGVLLLTGIVIAVGVWIFSGKGQTVQVRVNGSVVSEYPLSENRTVMLDGADGGTNLLVIENGTARIDKADCPDELCCKTGRISRSGQSIICLPHKLTVEITGDAQGNTDSDVDITVK